MTPSYVNEHVRLLRQDEQNKTETVEEKMFRIITFYNNTIHSTTNRKPIDFVNGKINEDQYTKIQNLIQEKKRKSLEKKITNRSTIKFLNHDLYSLKKYEAGKILRSIEK